MDIDEAIHQISQIHKHLTKAETFRGYRAATLFAIGLGAFLLAAFQSLSPVKLNDITFIMQWAVMAAVIGTGVVGKMFYDVFVGGTRFEKHQTIRVFMQFIPSLTAGFLITGIILYYEINARELLPGIWAVLFSLGVFSMRPYLPRFTGYIGLYYLIAGCVLLWMVPLGYSLEPWPMGMTFGIGHLLAAAVLQLDIARYRR